MADKKISQLTALSAANVASATDVLAIVDTSATETKKITAKDLIDGALNGGTANGVLYLNGSKVATSGATFAFDSSDRLIVGAGSAVFGARIECVANTSGEGLRIRGRASDATGVLSFGANAAATEYARIQSDNTSVLIFGTGASGTERMRLTSSVLSTDSSISVGIGTASPGSLWSGANKLVVGSGSAAAGLTIYTSTSTAGTLAFGDGTTGSDPYVGYVQYNHTDNTMLLGTSGTTKATLDSSGNLGLGVTPSLWNSDYKALNIGSKGIVYGRVGSQETAIGANWYRTTAAAFVYASNGFATFYAQDSGNHTWHIAPNNTSGAGATASFTQAMTLDASGNLGVGTTTPGQKLEVSGNQRFTGSQVGTKIENRNTGINVSTATTILDEAGAEGRVVIVNGANGGDRFCDLVFCSTAANPTVIASFTAFGTPTARTYTRNGAALQLAMASGTYVVNALALGY